MSASAFPDIDGVQHWYSATKDGLAGLRDTINRSPSLLSNQIHDELIGMTPNEWKIYHRKQMFKHEMIATLALFVACEGNIRRDFDLRSDGSVRLIHHARFSKIRNKGSTEHIPLNRILNGWIGAEKSNIWAKKYLINLQKLFEQRNDLAHGRVPQMVAFEPVYEKLSVIRKKWREAVGDFHGF